MLNHKTKEGLTMPIYSMEDSHLINTIKFTLNRLNDAKNTMFRDNTSGISKLLYKSGMSKNTAKDMLVNSDALLSPYILEALVRGFDVKEYVKTYSEIIERNTSIKFVKTDDTPQLSYSNPDDDIPF